MSISVIEISKNIKITKPVCPACKKPLYNIGLLQGSKVSGVTTVCKFCGRAYEIRCE